MSDVCSYAISFVRAAVSCIGKYSKINSYCCITGNTTVSEPDLCMRSEGLVPKLATQVNKFCYIVSSIQSSHPSLNNICMYDLKVVERRLLSESIKTFVVKISVITDNFSNHTLRH